MKTLFFVALLCLLGTVASAKSIEGLYDAKILVPDQQLHSRQVGAREGLLEVLQKVSGFAPADTNAVINQALKRADQYLYQYSYATLSSERAQQVAVGSKWLNMRFEGKSIQGLIKAAKLSRWGKNRPTIMVWLALDEVGERHIMADDSAHNAKRALQRAAGMRGLPLVYPLYDLEDAMKLPVEQLWGLFADPIMAASERYGAESVLAARVFQGPEGQWKGQWRFFFDGQERNYVFVTATLDEQVLSGLTAAAQVLADKFALKPSGLHGNQLSIEVDAVNSLRDYALLTQYLERLAITKQVAMTKLNKNRLAMKLALNGTFEQFKQTLSLDRKLVFSKAQPLAGGAFAPSDVIRLSWRP